MLGIERCLCFLTGNHQEPVLDDSCQAHHIPPLSEFPGLAPRATQVTAHKASTVKEGGMEKSGV